LAGHERVVLAGGDLARNPKFACDVMVCGAVPRGAALRRDGAKAGDAIYVSGRLGGSALGLARRRGAAWKKHTRPEPRLGLGRFLRERLRATAAMDLSDGLSLDLRRLCLASRLSATIQAPPRFPGATLRQALHGGEDYELLFTVRAQTRVPAKFQGIPLTRIGEMLHGPAGKVLLDGSPLEALGYDHFR
jgi:thiamine-monophosphate kinase